MPPDIAAQLEEAWAAQERRERRRAWRCIGIGMAVGFAAGAAVYVFALWRLFG